MSTIPLAFLPVLSEGACVRACPFRLQSSEGNLRAYTSHSQPSIHPHHKTPARLHTHRSRALTRRSGAREVWEASCIVVKPSHLVDWTSEEEISGFARLRHRAPTPRHTPIGRKVHLYAMAPIGGLAAASTLEAQRLAAGRSTSSRVHLRYI